MKRETKTTHKVTVGELVKALNISGEVTVCGFNQHQEKKKTLEREITIVTIDATSEKKKQTSKRKRLVR